MSDGDDLTYDASSSDTSVATVAIANSTVTVTAVRGGTATITVGAKDVAGSNTRTRQRFEATVANTAPAAVGTLSALTLRLVDGAGTVDVAGAFTDVDNDDLTYAATSAVDSVAAAAASGSTVTVTPVSKGVAEITVTASDEDGAEATQTFGATVANSPPAATETLPGVTLRVVDGARTVDVSDAFTDADADALTHAAASSATSVATASASGSSVTVMPVSRGTATITVTASDVDGAEARQTFRATIANSPPARVGTLDALTLRQVDGAATVDVSGAFSDPDNEELRFSTTSSKAAVARVGVADSVVTVTPVAAGEATVTVQAADGAGGSATQTFGVTVINLAPQAVGSLTGPGLQVGDGNQVVDVASAFEDPEEDTLAYAASSSAPAVAGASVSGSRVTLRPVSRGTATITVTATDIAGSNTPATQAFDVRVKARRGVTISRDALTVDEGSANSYTVVLNSEPAGDVTVTPSVPSDGSLSVDPEELTFTTGSWQVPQSVSVEAATDTDTDSEPPVTIGHDVTGADYGSVTASSVRVTIVEKDTSTLSVERATAAESGGSLRFEVTLSKAAASEIAVDYATSNGSGSAGARAGSDYTATSGTLTFPVNSTASRQIVVDVADDDEDEEEEEVFRLTLSNARHASLAGGGSTLVVVGTIEDDDDPEVEVSFGSSAYSVTEGGTAKVAVRLDRDPERDLELFLERTHFGGAEEADYSGVPRSVAFGPGIRSQEFPVAATDDTVDDDGESVVLSFLALPPRVTGDAETTIAIRDNDGTGGTGGTGGGGGGGGGGGPSPGDGDDDDGVDGGGGAGGGGSNGGPPKAAITTDAECAGTLCRARTGVPVSFEDTSTGAVRSRRWDFSEGRPSSAGTLRRAWPSPGFYEVTLWTSDGTVESTASLTFLVEASDPAGTCVADVETLCLQDSRYAVTVDWWLQGTGHPDHRHGSVVPTGTNDSGMFHFFGPNNWEVLIKVLDGCALNGHVWVFGASTTDLGYVIRVTDTVTGAVKEYRNEPGMPAPAITDGRAFPEGCR